MNFCPEQKYFTFVAVLSRSYCIVCVYVWEDKPQELASGVSPVQTENLTIYCLLHGHAFGLVHFVFFLCLTLEFQ